MYYAKDGSKGFVEFDNDMHERAVLLHQLETDLRAAVVKSEFEVFYQPIVDLSDARLSGFEALVRWRHPTRGLVSPMEFIPAAESTGLIVPMTEQIMRQACRQLVEWQAGYQSPLIMSVNLSGKHFASPDLVDQVDAVLDSTFLDPGSLKLEITESAVMENAEAAISMLHKIKRSGIKISIDDFGTGYSSLSYLQRFPIDTLKCDRSFVSMMGEKSENGAIVRTVVALAKALQLNVVAEGVETPDQFHRLRGLGCEYGQGYLFSRPLPSNDIEELLDDAQSLERDAGKCPDRVTVARCRRFSSGAIKQCGSLRVSKGVTRKLIVTPLLTRGLLHLLRVDQRPSIERKLGFVNVCHIQDRTFSPEITDQLSSDRKAVG